MQAKQFTPVVLSGLGSAGLNTQSQDSTLGPEWLTEADNVVFDYQGRIASRKGIKQVSKIVGASIKSIGGFIKSNRTREYYASSGSSIYKLDTSTTPNSLTAQSFAGSPQTISDSNWQFLNFNDNFWGIQSGHKVINYDGTDWKDINDLSSYAAPSGVSTFDPSCALGNFGRMWYGGVTEDPGVVYYSDTLIGQKVQGAAAGLVDLKTVWGSDEIVGFASLMNRLIIFGKENIVIYQGADNPSTMVLEEVVKGVGLAGRDNIVYVGSDVLFMSYEGFISLSRITETDGKAPIQELTISIRNDLTRLLSTADVNNIKTAYYQEDGLVITFIPDENKAYVFDFAVSNKARLPRTTSWSFVEAPLCGLGTIDGTFFMGLSNSVATYSDYFDVSISNSTSEFANQTVCEAAGNTWDGAICWSYTYSKYSYTFQTSWLDLNSPSISKIVKSGIFTIIGGRGATSEVLVYKDFNIEDPFSKSFSLTSNTAISLFNDVTTFYGVAKYASSAGPKEYKISLGRTGKTIRIKMTTEVNGNYSSLVNTMLLTKQGKIR
tara:strand:- start:1300 stop:2943 length:1644 start_codon:yes stop_codon:yes gene_type:complete